LMRVILKHDVKGLGKAGQEAEVAEGYARNYLIPKGLAVEASKGNIKTLRHQEDVKKKKEARQLEEARRAAERLGAAYLAIRTKVGESGKLFGSVTAKDISESIKAQLGLEIDKKNIGLEEPIKSVGSYTVPIWLHQGVEVNLKVDVVAE